MCRDPGDSTVSSNVSGHQRVPPFFSRYLLGQRDSTRPCRTAVRREPGDSTLSSHRFSPGSVVPYAMPQHGCLREGRPAGHPKTPCGSKASKTADVFKPRVFGSRSPAPPTNRCQDRRRKFVKQFNEPSCTDAGSLTQTRNCEITAAHAI